MKAYLNYSLLLIFSLSLSSCVSIKTSENTISQKDPLLVFLVRHAEKIDHSKDPELSESGKERTLELVKLLRSANIEYVHSSDYIRTRETAAPIAGELGLTPEIYDPKDLEALTLKITNKGGIHLIVGHSNTTPKMVELLGGDPVSKINEAKEYDRLYVVNVSSNGVSNSILMRYGHPYIESIEN